MRSPGFRAARRGEEELAPERHVEEAVWPDRGRVGADHLEPVRHPQGGPAALRLRRQVRCQLDADGTERGERLEHAQDPAGHAAPQFEMPVAVVQPPADGVRDPRARPHRRDDAGRERVGRHRRRVGEPVLGGQPSEPGPAGQVRQRIRSGIAEPKGGREWGEGRGAGQRGPGGSESQCETLGLGDVVRDQRGADVAHPWLTQAGRPGEFGDRRRRPHGAQQPGPLGALDQREEHPGVHQRVEDPLGRLEPGGRLRRVT